MPNDDLLSEFLADPYFANTVDLITKTVTNIKGRVEVTGSTTISIDCITPQPIKSKDLINEGLGLYTDKLSFSLFTKADIDQSKNNFISYKDKLYKIKKTIPWDDYGFKKYIICQYNDEDLNDN